MRDLADVFKALADETRLMMLALLLKKRELCVCDFEEVLRISQSKASRHLQTLKHAGFLSDRREGLWVYYRIPKGLEGERSAAIKLLRRLLSEERVNDLYAQLDQWLDQKHCDDSKACATQNRSRECR